MLNVLNAPDSAALPEAATYSDPISAALMHSADARIIVNNLFIIAFPILFIRIPSKAPGAGRRVSAPASYDILYSKSFDSTIKNYRNKARLRYFRHHRNHVC